MRRLLGRHLGRINLNSENAENCKSQGEHSQSVCSNLYDQVSVFSSNPTQTTRIDLKGFLVKSPMWYTLHRNCEKKSLVKSFKIEHTFLLQRIHSCCLDRAKLFSLVHLQPTTDFSSWMNTDRNTNKLKSTHFHHELLLLPRWVSAKTYPKDGEGKKKANTESNTKLHQHEWQLHIRNPIITIVAE